MTCNTNECELPHTPNITQTKRDQEPNLLYITDPICSACWAMEPAWRKLMLHYGEHFSFRHIYGGLLSKWEGFHDAGAGISKPLDVAVHWAEVAQYYRQPINPQVWKTDPLASSYPPSIALHVMRLLAPEKEALFLRKMREALFLEAHNIARLDVMLPIVASLGVDKTAFSAIWHSSIATEQFEKDLQSVKQLPVRGFPTLIFLDKQRQMAVLHGTQPYEQLERIAIDIFELERSTRQFSLDAVLTHYQSGTFKELAAALEMNEQTLKHELGQRENVTIIQSGNAIWWHLTPQPVNADAKNIGEQPNLAPV